MNNNKGKGEEWNKMMIPKLKYDTATDAFHFSNALTGFKNAWKHRQKNLDQFNNETQK